MRHRAISLMLIGLLLGGWPARPVLAGCALRVRVQAGSEKPGERLGELCARMRSNGLAVRVLQIGRSSWVEIAGGAGCDLGEALRQLRRAAKAAGLAVELAPDVEQVPQALSSAPAEGVPARPTFPQAAPAEMRCQPNQVSPAVGFVAQAAAVTKLPGIATPSARAIRAPPA